VQTWMSPPTLPLRSAERYTNTSLVDELGHQSCRGHCLLEEKGHQPSYLLGNLDEGTSEKVFLPLMVCASFLLAFGVRVAYLEKTPSRLVDAHQYGRT